MENSNSFSRQFIDFLGNDLRSSKVSTELQLRCSGESTNSARQPTLPPCTSYFEVSAKPGSDSSLREVTVTEVKKTKFLTSSSTFDRLLAYNQGSSFFGGGDSQGHRLLSSQQNALSFRWEEGPEGGNLPLLRLQDSARGGETQKTLPFLCLQDSPRGGETQNNLPKVPKNESVELNLGRDFSPPGPPPGFAKKFGPNSGNVILKDLYCPPHLRPPRLDGPPPGFAEKFGPNSENVTDLSCPPHLRPPRLDGPPPGFANKFGPNSGNVIDLSCPPHLRPPRQDEPPPGFAVKFGPNSGNVIPHSCPPHLRPPRLDPPICLGSETQKKVLVPKTEPKEKYEPNSATDISPPPDFSSKNYLGGASGKNIRSNEKLIDRRNSNGRVHSLPHPKYGPYKCPQCFTIYPTSQHYAAHVAGHHRNETLGEKKKRHIQKFNNRKFKMVQSPDGLTIVHDQASNFIDDEVEVVLGYKNQNGVVLNEEMDESVKIRTGISQAGKGHLHVRELKTREEILEASMGPNFARGLGKTRSPENRKEDVGSSSSHGNKRNPHWKDPFDFLKRTKPN